MLPGTTLPLFKRAGFPVVRSLATTNTVASTTHSINLPSGIQVGNLLLMLVGAASVTGISAGWTAPAAESTTNTVRYRIADGTETSPIVTLGAAYTCTAIVYRITDFIGVPESASNTSSNIYGPHDPPALSPTWGSKNTLWFAINSCGTYQGNTLATFPANYTSNATFLMPSPADSGTNNLLWSGYRFLVAATEDPGPFTTSTNVTANRNRTVAIQGR